MSNNILYLGFSPRKEFMDEIYKFDSRPAIQTVNYGHKLLKVLGHVGNVVNLSTPPIQDFPHGRKVLLTQKNWFKNRFIPFINIIGLKQLSRLFFAVFYIMLERYKNGGGWIVLHGVHTPFFIAALFGKIVGYKILLVATDPPGVVLQTDGVIRRLLKLVDKKIINMLFSIVDCLIVPTEDFVKNYRFNTGVSYIVVPGIVSEEDIPCIVGSGSLKGECINVCYSGSVYKDNGLDHLVMSANLFTHNISLHIVGSGEYIDDLKNIAGNVDNIYFHGFHSGESYEKLMQSMDVMLNVRDPDKGFTSYSFPSKLFEYLLRDKVVITSRLNNIPSELENCFEYFDDLSPAGIAKKINEVVVCNSVPSPIDNRKIVLDSFSIVGLAKKICLMIG
jgi:hypothetical protein